MLDKSEDPMSGGVVQSEVFKLSTANSPTVGEGNDTPQRSWLLARLGIPELDERQRRALFVCWCMEVLGEYQTLLSTLSLPAVQRSIAMPEDGLSVVAQFASLTGVLGIIWSLLTDVYGRSLFFRYGIPIAAANEILGGCVWDMRSMILMRCLGVFTPPTPGVTYLIEEVGPEGRGPQTTA